MNGQPAVAWRVFRHSGRRNDDWKEKHIGDETGARAFYAKLHADMRQGGVRLVGPSGEIVESDWAPRLRSRW